MRHQHTFRSLSTSILLLFLSAIPFVFSVPQSTYPLSELPYERQQEIASAMVKADKECSREHPSDSTLFNECVQGQLSSIGVFPATKLPAISSSLPSKTAPRATPTENQPTSTATSQSGIRLPSFGDTANTIMEKYKKESEAEAERRKKKFEQREKERKNPRYILLGCCLGVFTVMVLIVGIRWYKWKKKQKTTPETTRPEAESDNDKDRLPTYEEVTRN